MHATMTVEEAALKEGRIIIVDDGRQYVDAIQKSLARHGFLRVTGITDPAVALEQLRAECPDLLILDLHMPGMSGLDLLRELQNAHAAEEICPVLMLTGDTNPLVRDAALALGTMDYLNKPFRQSEVVLRVKNLLRMRLLHREVRQHAEELEQKVHLRTQQLNDAYLDTINRLARAAEFRDDSTGRHIQRVGMMAADIARKLACPKGFVEAIYYAAQLHDIGKIAIPDSILLKPGHLNTEEFDIVKKHPAIGADILANSSSDLMRLAAEIALTHHERWDGTGYPAGLKGDAIPLPGRIVAVADVFDALITERPYKRTWGKHEAVAEIVLQRGLMFDPAVVDAFLELAGND